MRIALKERSIQLSVREFSEFKLGPTASGFGKTSRRRAEIGQVWHKAVQAQASREFEKTEFEVPLQGTLRIGHWTVSLGGRIDQVIRKDGALRIREIKTVEVPLPGEEVELREAHPSYFLQLAAYLVLAALKPENKGKKILGELIFINISNGFMQSVSLPSEDREPFQNQLDAIHQFLRSRWEAKERLRGLEFNGPFPHLRPGQKDALAELDAFSNQSSILLFEAPTGFGKTGTILEFALHQMREDRCDRILYLTGKSTGQIQALKQLESMVGKKGRLNYFQMRNRAEHAINSPLHVCESGSRCRRNCEERWKEAGLSPMRLFEAGKLSLRRIKAIGRETGVCPYEISRAALPYADIWVADYNYIFAPRNKGVFFNQPGFDPGRTLLIIDEAHNLPSRAAAASSHSLSREVIETVCGDLQFSGAHPKLRTALSDLAGFLEKLEAPGSLSITSEYELAALLDSFLESFRKWPPDAALISPETLDQLWSCYDYEAFLEDASIEKLLWIPRPGTLNLTALEVKSEIAATLERFEVVILMSATLSPTDVFLQSCGLKPDAGFPVRGRTPWRSNAYRVGIDLTVDTRYRKRESYLGETSEAIRLLCASSRDPVVVFFPSFRYAETIDEHLERAFPNLRHALQPRGLGLAGQNRFLEKSLTEADAILLVLGSGFAEGIDLLGGRVSKAMVVGPALPEFNLIQEKRMEDRSSLPRREAFREVYQIPGMRKINQALGRLVRAPGQHAQILLQGRRFGETSYRELLGEEYRTAATLSSRRDLINWLDSNP